MLMVICGFIIICKLSKKSYIQAYLIHTLCDTSIGNIMVAIQLDNVDKHRLLKIREEQNLSIQDQSARRYRIPWPR